MKLYQKFSLTPTALKASANFCALGARHDPVEERRVFAVRPEGVEVDVREHTDLERTHGGRANVSAQRRAKRSTSPRRDEPGDEPSPIDLKRFHLHHLSFHRTLLSHNEHEAAPVEVEAVGESLCTQELSSSNVAAASELFHHAPPIDGYVWSSLSGDHPATFGRPPPTYEPSSVRRVQTVPYQPVAGLTSLMTTAKCSIVPNRAVSKVLHAVSPDVLPPYAR